MAKKTAIEQRPAPPLSPQSMDEAIDAERDDNAPDPAYLARMAERRESLRAEVARLLPPRSRFVWEIGCGHGHFLTAYAETHPNEHCIGIDINLDRVRRATKKRDRAGLNHLHFVRAEARLFLEVLPPDAGFTAIYMLFPDPWPKKRHHKHRLFKPEFLGELAARAGQGSRLFFRTDYKPYYDEAVAAIAAQRAWLLLPPDPFPFEHQTIFQSRAAIFHSFGATLAPASAHPAGPAADK
jgi:tRNA (guanine-N7-)-methyltransferase